MTILAHLPQVLQTVFTTVADIAGQAPHFTKRPDVAKFTARTWVQPTVLGWLAHPDATLDQLCQMASRLGVERSPQALDQRFDARSAACLEQVLHQAMTYFVAADPVAVSLLQRFAGVVVQDATTITLPNDFAEAWPSCGGRTTTTPRAALKCGVQLDLLTGALRPLALASGRTQDQALAFAAEPFAPGTLRIADLGFFNFATFAALSAPGWYWLSRTGVKLTLTDADGRHGGCSPVCSSPWRRVARPRSIWDAPGCRVGCWARRCPRKSPTNAAGGCARRRGIKDKR